MPEKAYRSRRPYRETNGADIVNATYKNRDETLKEDPDRTVLRGHATVSHRKLEPEVEDVPILSHPTNAKTIEKES